MGFVAQLKWQMQICVRLLQIAKIRLSDVRNIRLLLLLSLGAFPEPTGLRQGSQVSMHVARGSASLLSSHGRGPLGGTRRVGGLLGVAGRLSGPLPCLESNDALPLATCIEI